MLKRSKKRLALTRALIAASFPTVGESQQNDAQQHPVGKQDPEEDKHAVTS